MSVYLEAVLAWAVRKTMDTTSRFLFWLDPGVAGIFDAWCDSHGRWDRFR